MVNSNIQMADVAIMWDLENVQPGETFLIDELIQYSEQFGRIVIARAFADFHKYDPKIAHELISAQFELLHLPHTTTQKNSIDILMAVNATNTMVLHPNIEHYIIISGDYDFRGLVQTLQSNSKKVHMVCDTSSTRTELLRLVDSFQDMYELSDLAIETHPQLNTRDDLLNEVLGKINKLLETGKISADEISTEEAEETDTDDIESEQQKIKERAKQILEEKDVESEKLRTKVSNYVEDERPDVHQRIELALDKLQEAIEQACEEKEANQADHNTVLTRLKIIYPDLEDDLDDIAYEMGFDPETKWYSNFLKYAESRGKIEIRLDGATYYLSVPRGSESKTKKRTKKYFETIQKAIKKYGNGSIDISRLAQVMNDEYQMNYSDLGFSSFKASLREAQKRNFIKLNRAKDNLSWTVTLL